MQNEALYSRKSFLVSTGRSGCVGGGKGAHGPSTDAVRGASHILYSVYEAGVNKNLRETLRKRE